MTVIRRCDEIIPTIPGIGPVTTVDIFRNLKCHPNATCETVIAEYVNTAFSRISLAPAKRAASASGKAVPADEGRWVQIMLAAVNLYYFGASNHAGSSELERLRALMTALFRDAPPAMVRHLHWQLALLNSSCH